MSSIRCPETGEVAGGVLIVCMHQRYGPCLVCFRNTGRRNGPFYECPFGMYDGPPVHNSIYQTASDELWEETCGLIDCSAHVLLSIGHWSHRSPWKGLCAIRVDGLSRDQFFTNREAIQQIRRDILEDFPNGSGLGSSLEMDHMSFVSLDVLEDAMEHCDQYEILEVRDVDNRFIRMRLLFDQLREGGIDLVKQALQSDRVHHLCSARWKVNPSRELHGHSRGSFQGPRQMVGVESLCIELLRIRSAEKPIPSSDSSNRRKWDDQGGGGGDETDNGSLQKKDRHDSDKRHNSNHTENWAIYTSILLFLVAIIVHQFSFSKPLNRKAVIERVVLEDFIEFGLSSNYDLSSLEDGLPIEALHQAYMHSSDKWESIVCQTMFSKAIDLELCLVAFNNLRHSERKSDLDRLSKFIRHLRTSLAKSLSKSSTRVGVIGGGPAGLIAALGALQAGCKKIDLFEKRLSYDRNIYFDLSDNEFGSSMAVMTALGLYTQNVGLIIDNPGVVTIKCAELEHFLAKVLRIAGVKFHFGFEFVSLCHPHAVFMEPSLNMFDPCGDRTSEFDSSVFLSYDFDIVIGSDGTRSKLRQELNASFETITRLELSDGGIVDFPVTNPLIGLSVIASFKLVDGKCPQVKLEHKDNPFAVASSVHGVSSAFKRFFFKHCELQVAISPWAIERGSDFPWDILLRVSQEILETPPAHVQQLEEQLLTYKLLELPVRKINQVVFPLGNDKHAIFVGDSQVSALYRLATGVNFQISNLPFLRRVLQTSSKTVTADVKLGHWRRFTEAIDKRVDSLMNNQLSALFFESICGLVVFQDEIWRAHGSAGLGFSGPLSNVEALNSCNTTVPWTYRQLHV